MAKEKKKERRNVFIEEGLEEKLSSGSKDMINRLGKIRGISLIVKETSFLPIESVKEIYDIRINGKKYILKEVWLREREKYVRIILNGRKEALARAFEDYPLSFGDLMRVNGFYIQKNKEEERKERKESYGGHIFDPEMYSIEPHEYESLEF